jgi:DNA-binding transcriptional ArsR family regulator
VFEITLRVEDGATAARIFSALADALGDQGVSLVAKARASEPPPPPPLPRERPLAMEPPPEDENMIDDPAVVKAITTGKIMRLTDSMNDVIKALADNGGEAHRGALASALPDRSNNSIGRSLAALGRGGIVEARFEGSDTFRLTALGEAVNDGRVKSRIDTPIRPEDREPSGGSSGGSSAPEPPPLNNSAPEGNSKPDGRSTTWLSR